MESADSENEEASCSASTPQKKRKLIYNQKYKSEWEKEFKWLSSSKKGHLFAW